MSTQREPAAVRSMFDRIAPGYDLTNSVMSLGRDRAWRRLAADAAALQPGDAVIDVACGTGLVSVELHRRTGRSGRVVGVDFSEVMLARARRRDAGVEWISGDALALPFADASFDAATIAFGLRNLADPLRGLSEMRRVVQGGGRLVLLEFLRPPPGLLGRAFAMYLRHFVGFAGGRITGDPAAYRYLSQTVDTYLTGQELLHLAVQAGWHAPRLRRLNLGTVALMRGSVAGSAD